MGPRVKVQAPQDSPDPNPASTAFTERLPSAQESVSQRVTGMEAEL